MSLRAGGDELTVRVIRTEGEWDALHSAWDDLYAACPDAAAPVDFAWMRTWWRFYGATYGPGGLRIVTAWRSDELVAVLPLYLSAGDQARAGGRCLRFISTGEAEHEEVCPEYLDLICRPVDAPVAAEAIWDEVNRLTWDCLEWLDLRASSPLLRARSLPPGAAAFSRGSCPIADLSSGFDDYVERLSSKGRKEVRRLLRDAETLGARLEVAGEDQADAAFEDLCRLHQARWEGRGEPGVFAAPRFAAFHRDLVRQWLPGGRAVLARLWLGEEPAAVLYGFVAGAKVDIYQSGVRMDAVGTMRSPGTLLHLLLMQALVTRGITAYDFLSGAAFYKDRLATREQALAGIRIWRTTPRALAARVWQFSVRRLGRYARSRTGGTAC